MTTAKWEGNAWVMPRPTGRVRVLSTSCGSSRVGSGGVGNVTGPVGSGHGGFRSLRVGSDRPDPTRPATSDTARQEPCKNCHLLLAYLLLEL